MCESDLSSFNAATWYVDISFCCFSQNPPKFLLFAARHFLFLSRNNFPIMPRAAKTTPYQRPARRSASTVATDDEYDRFKQDERSFNGSQMCLRRIEQNLTQICAKFNRPFRNGETDIVDLNAWKIVKDHGQLRGMKDRELHIGESLALKVSHQRLTRADSID